MADTHQVFNQSTPLVDINLYQADPSLREAVTALAGGDLGTHEQLNAMGARYGSAQAQQWAVQANVNKPVLRTHDRFGHRIDEAEFHPAYHHLMAMALQDGLHASPWAQPGPGAQVRRAAAYHLFGQLENGVQCPTTMTFAVVPVIARQSEIAPDWLPKLLANDYQSGVAHVRDKRAVTMGMGMTEKQGGSDVRSNTTEAVAVGRSEWGQEFRVTGHKWFCLLYTSDAADD